jgi:hypothetical protein
MDEKPPSSVRQSTSIRVRSSLNNRCTLRCREMAFIQRLSNPNLSARFRNDLVILETI